MNGLIKRRDLIGSLAAAPLLARHGGAAAQAPVAATLRMGGFPQAPLVTGADREPVQGLVREFITSDVAPHTPLRFVWLDPCSMSRALQSLLDGFFDILLSRGDVSMPEGTGRFSWPLTESVPTLAVPLDSPLHEVHSPEQLAGLTLGRTRDGTVPIGLMGVNINWVFTTGQNWQLVNLRMVERHRLDGCVFFNSFSPAYLAKTEHLAVRLLPLPLPPTRFYMWYSQHSDKAAIAEFDRVAGEAFRGGRFARLLSDSLK